MRADNNAAQRAYEETKRKILDGVLAVRTRIDVEALARELGLSSMPVRQALAILVWERLVKPGRQSGFEVALWSERELADLYAWRGTLLTMALPTNAAASELKRIARLQPYPQAVRAVLATIEEGANPELKRASVNADERLHAVRAIEPEVLGDVQGELETLVEALAERSRRAGALFKSYQRRRIENAGQLRDAVILRATPRNGSG